VSVTGMAFQVFGPVAQKESKISDASGGCWGLRPRLLSQSKTKLALQK